MGWILQRGTVEEMLLGKVSKGVVPIGYFRTRGALFPAVYQ
jgi:hypothetical protein